MCVPAKSLQSCLTLCNSMDCSLPRFSVHGVPQAGILEGLPCPSLGHLPYPGIEPLSLTSAALAGEFFTTSTTWDACRYVYIHIYVWIVFIYINVKK